jgi:hypothetical protein
LGGSPKEGKMIIDSVKRRKSGTIAINYTDGGKQYGLIITPHEIVENYLNRPTRRAVDGDFCPDCDTVSVDSKCSFCGGVLVHLRN